MFSRALQVASNKAASSVALVRKESFVVVQKRANSSDAFPDDMHDDNGYSEELPRQAREQGSGYHAIYRPNKDISKGAAFQFLFTPSKKSVFITAAKQKGEKLPPRTKGEQFDYKNKIVVKVGVSEMPAFLKVLRMRAKEMDLLHTTERATQTIKLKAGERNTFLISLSRKEANGLPYNAKANAKVDPSGPPSFDDIPFEGESSKASNADAKGTATAPSKGPTSIGMYIDENESIALDVFFTEAMKKSMGFE
jgi:hypothetical protein